MSSTVTVPINYSSRVILTSSEISYTTGGTTKTFDCNKCTYTGCCNTDDPTFNPDRNLCYKCSCQNKGTKECSRSDFCDAFQPGCCGCSNSQKTNPVVWSDPITETVPCNQAISMVQDTTNFLVYNTSTVQTVCDPVKRLQCCKGIGTANLCATYWGPGNTTGDCDAIMLDYCSDQVHASETVCNCINSTLPLPECVDRSCTNSGAYKTLAMVNDPCDINLQVCQQFVTMSPEAANNLIIDSPIVQACTQNNPAASSAIQDAANRQATQNMITIIIIVVIVVVGVVLLGLISIPIYKAITKNKQLTRQLEFQSGTSKVQIQQKQQASINAIQQQQIAKQQALLNQQIAQQQTLAAQQQALIQNQTLQQREALARQQQAIQNQRLQQTQVQQERMRQAQIQQQRQQQAIQQQRQQQAVQQQRQQQERLRQQQIQQQKQQQAQMQERAKQQERARQKQQAEQRQRAQKEAAERQKRAQQQEKLRQQQLKKAKK